MFWYSANSNFWENGFALNFALKNGIKYSTALKMLNVTFGESFMNKKRGFQEDHEDVEDDDENV